MVVPPPVAADFAAKVTQVRQLTTELTDLLSRTMVTAQYKLSDAPPYSPGDGAAAFEPCAIERRLAALRKGAGLLGLLGLPGPWERAGPACS